MPARVWGFKSPLEHDESPLKQRAFVFQDLDFPAVYGGAIMNYAAFSARKSLKNKPDLLKSS